MELIFTLLIAFQTKHLVADYFLQGEYQLGKFNRVGWAGPLALHCGIHAVLTLLILLVVGYGELALGFIPSVVLADFVLHFVIDKMKVEGSRSVGTDDKEFWWLLGIDQWAHHMTHYAIIAAVIIKLGGLS